jgi:membrane-associated phospholipid phosphatase
VPHSRWPVVFVLMVLARAGGAQDSATAPRATVHTLAPPTLRRDERWLIGAFAAGGLALMPFDSRLAVEIREPEMQSHSWARTAARGFNWWGGAGVLTGAIGTYAVGRLAKHEPLTEIGLHSTEAIAMSGLLVAAVKGITGRDRPFMHDDDADLYSLGGGFQGGGHTSFPSGHTAAAFAGASALTLDVAYRWPRAKWYVGAASYGVASAVGLSRMYTNDHWASDVVFGAGIGLVTGLRVTRRGHEHPRGRTERWFGRPLVAPTARGAVIGWEFRER